MVNENRKERKNERRRWLKAWERAKAERLRVERRRRHPKRRRQKQEAPPPGHEGDLRKRKKREQIEERDITGLKYFDKLQPLLERLHKDGCERDKAGNRDLHFDQYGMLILLYLFNPVVTSLRGIQQASELAKVQRKMEASWRKRQTGNGMVKWRLQLSHSQNGIEIQTYCAIIACLLISLWTGRKPTLRTYEMICFYFCGLASEEELSTRRSSPAARNQSTFQGKSKNDHTGSQVPSRSSRPSVQISVGSAGQLDRRSLRTQTIPLCHSGRWMPILAYPQRRLGLPLIPTAIVVPNSMGRLPVVGRCSSRTCRPTTRARWRRSTASRPAAYPESRSTWRR